MWIEIEVFIKILVIVSKIPDSLTKTSTTRWYDYKQSISFKKVTLSQNLCQFTLLDFQTRPRANNYQHNYKIQKNINNF